MRKEIIHFLTVLAQERGLVGMHQSGSTRHEIVQVSSQPSAPLINSEAALGLCSKIRMVSLRIRVRKKSLSHAQLN